MIPYSPDDACCGVRPGYYLLDEPMASHFRTCAGGTPEAPLIDWAWQRYGRPGDLFLDIGSHVGSWALPFALAGMRVMAFEPNPSIYDLLQQAATDNELSYEELQLVNAAVGEDFSTARLTAPGIDGGMASIVLNYNLPLSENVDVIPLDPLCLAPSLMKVDVEGAELDVLRGAKKTIEDCEPVIFFECWEDERGQRIEELFGYVESIGYRAERTFWPEMWVAEPCS